MELSTRRPFIVAHPRDYINQRGVPGQSGCPIICDRCPSWHPYPHQRRRFAARASDRWKLIQRPVLYCGVIRYRYGGDEHAGSSTCYTRATLITPTDAHPARLPSAPCYQPALRAFRGRPLINPSPATRIDLQRRSRPKAGPRCHYVRRDSAAFFIGDHHDRIQATEPIVVTNLFIAVVFFFINTPTHTPEPFHGVISALLT